MKLLRDMNKQEVESYLQTQREYQKSLEHPHKTWTDSEYQHYEQISRAIIRAEDRLYELQGYPDAD